MGNSIYIEREGNVVTNTMNILKVDNITRSFDGVKALNDVSFSIQGKTINGLIGPNGAGKTTLFNVISGLVKPDNGRIYYNNLDIISKLPYEISRLGIGKLWQEVRVFSKLTVLENILTANQNQPGENPLASFFLAKKVKKSERENLENAEKWIKFVGLKEEVNKFAEDLSYGEQKLLALARLLATESKLLLLDEPATGINPEMIKKIHNLLKELVNQGKTIIIIEHNIRFVKEIADNVLLMHNGKIIASGSPDEIIDSRIMEEVYIRI